MNAAEVELVLERLCSFLLIHLELNDLLKNVMIWALWLDDWRECERVVMVGEGEVARATIRRSPVSSAEMSSLVILDTQGAFLFETLKVKESSFSIDTGADDGIERRMTQVRKAQGFVLDRRYNI